VSAHSHCRHDVNKIMENTVVFHLEERFEFHLKIVTDVGGTWSVA
jgi:hypothetical protein